MTALATRASGLDAFAHGEYRPPASTTSTAPAFRGRINRHGSTAFPAVAGRYHLYTARTSSASHRVEILRQLAGVADVVSLSRVDGLRDGRGWAFRGATGPDRENGFTLLRDAYEASRPGYHGHVSVPVLWDRETARIVSTDATAIGIDLATQFAVSDGVDDGVDVYPVQRVGRIEQLSATLVSPLTSRLAQAAHDRDAATAVRGSLRALDQRLADRAYLLDDVLTDADVRLWVGLVRYDVGANAHGAIGPALATFEHLWHYARRLHALPAFASTTDLASFAAPLTDLSHWAA